MPDITYHVIAKIAHVGFNPRLREIVDIPANTVLRSGFCNHMQDGSFNSTNEYQIQNDERPCIRCKDYYWNPTTEEFQETPPE